MWGNGETMIETGTVDFFFKDVQFGVVLFFWCPFVFCFVFFSLFDLSMTSAFWDEVPGTIHNSNNAIPPKCIHVPQKGTFSKGISSSNH